MLDLITFVLPKVIIKMATVAASSWSDQELAAVVESYMWMLRQELAGTVYVKSAVNQALREGVLSNRTKGSIEFRMQNISAALHDLKVPYIPGYLPAKNVGTNVMEKLKSVLEASGVAEYYAYIPTADHHELSSKVALLLKKPLGKAPSGQAKPAQVSVTTTTFVRDPAVKRWVLNQSGGMCEGCDVEAPFKDIHGVPYLEVHHATPLASNGSDTISNAVALCPNCHRRCHFSSDRDEFKLFLYEKIGRLQIEVPDIESATSTFI